MTDEEALSEANRERDNVAEQFWSVSDIDPEFAAGFRAGLAHARQWRPLTSDPKTWPEEGQVVVLCEDFYPIDEELNRCGPREPRYCVGPFTSGCKEFWSWWLPLPEPPKEKSE